MSNFGTTDFYLETSKGKKDGHEIINIFASNPQVGTIVEDVWDRGGVLTHPTANETLEMVSTGTDTAAGTGAKEVTIRYMDDTRVEQSPLVLATNAGTVNFGVSNYFRMIDARVTGAGSAIPKGNAGNITFQVAGGGGAANTIRGQINAGENQILDSHFTVPAGKTGFMILFYDEINKNEDCRFKIKRTDGDNGIFRTISSTSVYQGQFGIPLKAPAEPMEEKTDFYVTCVSSNTTAIGSIFVQLIIIDNALVDL